MQRPDSELAARSLANLQLRSRYQIGDLVLDTGKREVSQSGVVIELPRLSYRLLEALAAVSPAILTHDETTEHVWEGRHVSAETVTQRVMLLRQALGDDAHNPRYIGLIRGQGYRLLHEVELLSDAEPVDATSGGLVNGENQILTPRKGAERFWLAGVALIVPLVFLVNGVLQKTNDETIAVPGNSNEVTVAVLPLKNMSPAEQDAYFVEGMHDDILTSLAKVDSLDVISRTSVEQFRHTTRTIREIGEEIGADAVLEGGVQRVGDRIRVNVQLIDVETDSHIWVSSFDEELTVANVFAIQSEIANSIARATRNVLFAEDYFPSSTHPTENFAAYEAYQRGVQLLRRRTGASIEAAIGNFKQAINSDASFVSAYVGLADSYLLMPSYAVQSAERMFPLAMNAARKAIQLEPANGGAYATLAMVNFEAARANVDLVPLEDPEVLFRRALALSPKYATGHQWYGEFLTAHGRTDEALAQFEIAMEIDPSSPILNHVYAHLLARLGEHDEAEEKFERAIEIDPGFSRAYQGLASHYFNNRGRAADAAFVAKQAILLNPTDTSSLVLLSHIYVQLGDELQAQYWLDRAYGQDPENYHCGRVKTLLHLRRNEYQAAAKEARRGLANDPHNWLYLNVLRNHYLLEGDIDAAAKLFESAYPELAENGGLHVSAVNFPLAIDYALVLQKSGRNKAAESILKQSLQHIDNYRIQDDYRLDVLRASVYALSNDASAAIASLRLALDAGWQKNTFYHFEQNPNFDNIRNLPTFQNLANEAQSTMAVHKRDAQARVEPARADFWEQ